MDRLGSSQLKQGEEISVNSLDKGIACLIHVTKCNIIDQTSVLQETYNLLSLFISPLVLPR